MKKALVLCGGLPQISLIKELKARGIESILLDMNENVIARKYADKFYPVSVMDAEAVKEVAIKEKVDYILTVCADQVLLVVAKLCEELGLPWYIDYETAKKVSYKSIMKEIFIKTGIPTSKYYITDDVSSGITKEIKYPAIIKPIDSYSSRGVTKVYNDSDLTEAVKNAIKISKSKTAIVEEYVEGTELSVDVYVENGRAKVLCISKIDTIPENNQFVINRCCCPAPISEKEIKRVEEVCQKLADEFGLVNAPMLVQLKSTENSLSVLEFSARTGGGNKFRLIKKATGFDVIKAVVDLTLGKQPEVKECDSENKIILDEFLYCKPGLFDHLEGFEEMKNQGQMSEYYELKSQGTQLKEASSSGDRVAYFTIQADSFEEIKKRHKKIGETIKAVDTQGNDLLRHDLISIEE